MDKKDIKFDKQRIRFSKKVKREILLEVAKGAKIQDVLLKHIFSSLNEITQDKKYAPKLLYKWKQELYKNKEILNLLNHNIDLKAVSDEIKNIGDDKEEDFSLDEAVEELKVNFLRIL